MLIALLLAGITAGMCRGVAGISVGLFFGGTAFATLLAPPLVAGERTLAGRLLVTVSVAVGVSLVWLTALGDLLTFSQWLACSAALFAYTFALCGSCSLLISFRFNAVLTAGLLTFVGVLWLTWPVWLSHALLRPSGDTLVEWLVPAHPLFAMNGVLSHFDTWDRLPLAYSRLTVLNQDVFYELPPGVLWTIVIHGLIGLISTGFAAVLLRNSDVKAVSQEAADPAAAAK